MGIPTDSIVADGKTVGELDGLPAGMIEHLPTGSAGMLEDLPVDDLPTDIPADDCPADKSGYWPADDWPADIRVETGHRFDVVVS